MLQTRNLYIDACIVHTCTRGTCPEPSVPYIELIVQDRCIRDSLAVCSCNFTGVWLACLLQVLDSQLLEMNWGMATVFIHQKITGAPDEDSEHSVMSGRHLGLILVLR